MQRRGSARGGPGQSRAPAPRARRAAGREILDAYERTGFYVFEDVIDEAELAALRGELEGLLERAPVDNGAKVDRQGRPAYGQEFARPVFSLIRPLVDPWGGTAALGGRHPVKMAQPTFVDEAAPRSCFS